MSLLPYFVGILALLFIAFQFYPYFKLKASCGKASPAIENLLNNEQKERSRVLLYFMAPRCGMCRGITPIVDALASERSDIVRIDASAQPDLARAFSVFGTPAFVLLQDGLVKKVKLGGLTKKKILMMLET